MCNSPCANTAVLRAVALCVALLHKHDLQTSACKSRITLLLLFPDFPYTLLHPSGEGSFCRNGEEPVLIFIRSVNPTAGRIQNLVKTLLIHLFFVVGLFWWCGVWWFFWFFWFFL